MHFASYGPDVYELIILDGLPSKVVSNSDNPPKSFHTSDTFTPHATIPNAWKYLGRLDDRITLVNGEKCLPIPFEHQVRENKYVQECWLFGIGRTLPGIMVVPSEKSASLSKAELFDRVWASIEAANSRVESFSRVSKEMTEILDIGTEYPRTDKGTMVRARTYARFSSGIDNLYERFEKGFSETGVKRAFNTSELEQYLLDALQNIGVHGLTAQMDLFEAGVDSLQAITIRGLIRRELDLGNGGVSQNVVFENPSISSLSQHLYALRTNKNIHSKDELKEMAELIENYSQFSQHFPGLSSVTSETIVSLWSLHVSLQS
jgi:Phosphopantetheine attachment site